MGLKDDILARVEINELIGQYVALKLAGREFKGCCPFHEEKTPSFHVNPEKGLFHCFGCKAGGSVIDFVMRIENLEFKEALEWLARRYNIEVRYEPGQQQEQSLKARYRKLNEASAKFFRQSLKAPAGGSALDYLERRGISERQVSDFDLGYAPREWSALGDMLIEHGAQSKMLLELGLIKQRSGDSSYGQAGRNWYDAFRHRLIFPIRSATGDVIAFAGRALSDEDKPKYINSTNTPLYDKSKTLYNLDRAKGVMRDEGAVIVEGYMDVIGLAGAGVQNAVASCGTALTSEHVKLLRRYTDRFYLAFDGDEAGRKAAWSAGVLFLTQGFDARVVALPTGVDPDDLVRERGEAAWRALLSQAKGVVAFWMAHLNDSNPHAIQSTKNRWVQQVAPLYARIPDGLLKHEMKKSIASELRMGAEEVESLFTDSSEIATNYAGKIPRAKIIPSHTSRKALRAKGILVPGEGSQVKELLLAEKADAAKQAVRAADISKLQGTLPTEREVLRRLLEDAAFRQLYTEQAAPEWFSDQRLATMYAELSRLGSADALINHESFAALCAELLTGEALADSNANLLARHRNEHLKRAAAEVYAAWEQASRAGDSEQERELHLTYLELKQQIQHLNSSTG